MASPFQGAASSGNDRGQSLLSLLRFSQAPPGGGGQQPGELGRPPSVDITSGNTLHEHKITETELVKGSTTPSAREERSSRPASSIIQAPDTRDSQASSGAEETSQEALLRLVNRSQLTVSQSSQSGISEPRVVERNVEGELQQDPISTQPGGKSPMTAPQQREDSPFRLSSGQQSRGSNPVGAPQAENAQVRKEHKPIFTYTNPFEALNASRAQSVKPQSRTSSPAVGLRENNTALSLPNGDKREYKEDSPEPTSARKKLTPKVPIHPPAATQQVVVDHTLAKQAESVANDSKKEHGVPNEATETSHESDKPKPALGDRLGNTSDASSKLPVAEVKVTRRDENVPGYEPHGRPAQVPKGLARDADDAWESAGESPAKDNPTRVVPVYNFPIKPFVSIAIKPSPPSSVGFRDDGVMEISKYKKEFDQLDRSLAAATSKYITYALVKSGGIRIIRQEDGKDHQVFKNSHDRIFSVAICSTAPSSTPSESQAVLGVGVSGSVYYATISKHGKDFFEDDMLDIESLIFPPFPLGDENTSGGVLKTRAKKSSRHPEFFAIGRGKSINLVWPATAMSSKYGINGADRKVDVEKLYNDRSLKITTGKAGKDFAFSEDDTLIVSLDKTGRLRFWDIRSLVEESNATASKVAPVDVRMPLLTLATASPTEKSWPTSVLFIDKLRPYTKVAALRYVLVGLKQNHTLQLWDIGLGKAVQELNFPHETETDGICSVSYHPSSGIIVVGHPTRNSIYFIHLSAPRYSLPSMTQAAYLERLAVNDPDLPKPDSTACMSGIREISFAAKGQLRSVELLSVQKGPEVTKEMADGLPLFELYVVHSRGVTCLSIRKDDLGWSSDSKVLNPINAAEEGLITLKELRLGAVINEGVEPVVAPDEVSQPTKAGKKKSLKKTVDMAEGEREPIASVEAEISAVAAAPVMAGESQVNGAKAGPAVKVETPPEKEAKRSKKKTGASNTLAAPDAEATSGPSLRNISPSKTPSTVVPQGPDTSTANTMEAPNTQTRTPGQTNIPAAQGDSERVTVGISGDWLDRELKKVERAVSGEFRKELTDLYQHIQNDRNVQDSAAVARQEAVLRLISSTLSTNIEKSLGRIILTQMQQAVVPSITGVTVQAVSAQVGEAIARVLHQLVPHELGTQLPVAISTAMQNPQISRLISETVSQKVAPQVESHMADLLRTTITPAFKNLASSVAEQAAVEVENRLGAQIQQIQTDRANDSIKIDSLHQVLNGIAETLQAMSATQEEFRKQILRDRQQLAQLSSLAPTGSSRQVSTARQLPAPIAPPTPTKLKTQDEIEDEEIAKLMDDGRYEEASIRWLQSSKPVELFDKLFVRFTPDYLATDVSPLVAFSVGITVGNSLSTNTARRLDWINAAFEAVDLRVSY
jgi:WD40 repeat protein